MAKRDLREVINTAVPAIKPKARFDLRDLIVAVQTNGDHASIMDRLAKIAEARPIQTDSLAEATEAYAIRYAELMYLRRAATAAILNALDEEYPISDQRLMLRKVVVDELAHYSREVQRWVLQEPAAYANPSPGSNGSEKS